MSCRVGRGMLIFLMESISAPDRTGHCKRWCEWKLQSEAGYWSNGTSGVTDLGSTRRRGLRYLKGTMLGVDEF